MGQTVGSDNERGDDSNDEELLERQPEHIARLPSHSRHSLRASTVHFPRAPRIHEERGAVSAKDRNWKYVEDSVDEDAIILAARTRSSEFGITPISPAQGAQIAAVAAASGARAIVEIGTGLGVSTLWLLTGAPQATITSIDIEPDFQQAARLSLQEAGHAQSRVRMISGRGLDVLPRLNDRSYDLVLVDADVDSIVGYLENALRLVRPGGTVLVPHVLWRDRVADPTQRDERTVVLRTLIKDLAASESVLTAVSPVGDGLLQITTVAP